MSQTSTSPTLQQSAAQKMGAEDSLPIRQPASLGKNNSKLLDPTGGTIRAITFGGFQGTFGYAPNDAQAGVTITINNSGQENNFNAPLPPGPTPVLFLAALVNGNHPVDFQAVALKASISSASLSTGSSYTMYLYDGSTQVAVVPLGLAGKGQSPQLKFASPLQGVSITPGTPLVMVVAPTPPPSPNVFVADYGNGVLKEILAPEYTTVNTIGPNGSAPLGVAVDGSGNLYFCDGRNSTVNQILAPGYTTINTLGSGFSYPTGVAVDGSGNVYVADEGNNAVKEILAPDYSIINTLGSGFRVPQGVAVDEFGNVFVADTVNNAVKEILAPGYTTVNTLGSGFSAPNGVAVDESGNVYVGDTSNNAVKEILAPGYTTVNTLGSGFFIPTGVAVDESGNVYVTDSGNSAVKEILAPGYTTVTTLGSGFSSPYGLALEPTASQIRKRSHRATLRMR